MEYKPSLLESTSAYVFFALEDAPYISGEKWLIVRKRNSAGGY